MSLSADIDNILNSNEEVFPEILEKILKENLANAKDELEERQKLNKILYDAIDFTVKKLDEEEGNISKLLYKAFGIGKDKNPRREQLLVLGGQLKGHITSLERDRKKIGFYYDNLSSSHESLTRLSEGFGRKVHFLTNPEQQKQCNRYLKDLYLKIDETDACRKELDMKSIYLESCIYKYDDLLKKIPRYKEIREDRQIAYNPSEEEDEE